MLIISSYLDGGFHNSGTALTVVEMTENVNNFTLTGLLPIASDNVRSMIQWDNIGMAGLQNGRMAFYDLEQRTLIKETQVGSIILS